MYKFLFVFLVSFLFSQKKCELFFSNTYLSEDGKLTFVLKNLSEKKIKVPKQYPSIYARPIDMQIYNNEEKKYINTKYVADDIDCFKNDGCFGKKTCLMKGEVKEYEVKVIPGRVSRAFKEKKKYRFKLAFDTYAFSGCNNYVTDWLYYDNEK